MADLQSTLQSILSDPAQMAQLQAMAGALGFGAQPGAGEAGPEDGAKTEQNQPHDIEGQAAGQVEAENRSIPNPLADGQAAALLGALGKMQGREVRVLSALRPTLSEAGRRKADRALQAAKLSRLAGLLFSPEHGSHV